MEIETRQAALCVIRNKAMFLVAEIVDPHSGAPLHRPPGGGLEEGETPEMAVRRELYEELGIRPAHIRELGAIDHTWFWNGREVRERAWIFLVDSMADAGLSQGETPEVREAGGCCYRTVWRSIHDPPRGLPPLCPTSLLELLER